MSQAPNRPGTFRLALALIITFCVTFAFAVGYSIYKAPPDDRKVIIVSLIVIMSNAIGLLAKWFYDKSQEQ